MPSVMITIAITQPATLGQVDKAAVPPITSPTPKVAWASGSPFSNPA